MANLNDIASAIIGVSSILSDYSNAKAEQEAQRRQAQDLVTQSQVYEKAAEEQRKTREAQKFLAEQERLQEEEALRRERAAMTPQQKRAEWEAKMKNDAEWDQLKFQRTGIFIACQNAIYNDDSFRACGESALAKFYANQSIIYNNEYKWASKHDWEYRPRKSR